MSQEKHYKVVIPEGTHLDDSRATPGAQRATLRDNRTNKLVGHAELHEVDDFDYEYTFDDGQSDSEPEIGLGGALAGLALIGLSLGAVAVAGSVRDRKAQRRDEKRQAVGSTQSATPPPGWYDVDAGRQRWWNGTTWTEHFRADPHHASAPAGWYDDGSGRHRWWDGFVWTDHFQAGQSITHSAPHAAHGATHPSGASDVVVATDVPHLTMSSAEWQERVRAMLLARAISERQWQLLSVARIHDASSELLGWQQQLAGITPQQFADQLHLAIQPDPAAAEVVTQQAVAGWYDDGSGQQRWWDGLNWTEHLRPQVLRAYAAEPQIAPPGWYDDGSGRQRMWEGQCWR